MTNRFMVSVAALALLAGTGIANAQGMNKESGGATGGATTQHSTGADTSTGSKSESSGPAKAQSPEKGGMKSTQSEQKQPGAMKKDRAEDTVKGGSTSQRAEDRAKGATDTNQRAEERNKGTETKQRAEERKGSQTTTGQAGSTNTRENNMKSEGRQDKNAPGAAENNRMDKNAPNAAENKSTTERNQTTGQAAAGAKLTTEQQTKITNVIKNERVESVDHVNFSISVGTRVPREGVRFYPLPQQVVVIYPQWRGYEYIRVHNQVLVVDPNTYEIVAILDV
jgi:hypothetical protein